MSVELNCLTSFKWFLTDYRIKVKLLMMGLLSISSELLPTTSQYTKHAKLLEILDYAMFSYPLSFCI